MNFELIPAIDIRGGKCVRLFQGDYARETVFGEDPVEMARRWEGEGATRLHLVDLDAARTGESANLATIAAVAAAVALVIVFRRFIDVPSDGFPYAVFALLGYALWTYVSSTIGAVTGSLLGDPALVTKVYFPRIVIPLAAIVPGLVDLAVTLVVIAALMIATGTAVAVQFPLFALVVVFAMVVALGAGLWLSTMNVLYRDVGHGIGFVLQLWFFASPVAYPTSLVAKDWQLVYAINPVVGLIDAARAAVLGAPVRPAVIAVSVASALVLLVTGALFFQRLERRFADVI